MQTSINVRETEGWAKLVEWEKKFQSRFTADTNSEVNFLLCRSRDTFLNRFYNEIYQFTSSINWMVSNFCR